MDITDETEQVGVVSLKVEKLSLDEKAQEACAENDNGGELVMPNATWQVGGEEVKWYIGEYLSLYISHLIAFEEPKLMVLFGAKRGNPQVFEMREVFVTKAGKLITYDKPFADGSPTSDDKTVIKPSDYYKIVYGRVFPVNSIGQVLVNRTLCRDEFVKPPPLPTSRRISGGQLVTSPKWAVDCGEEICYVCLNNDSLLVTCF